MRSRAKRRALNAKPDRSRKIDPDVPLTLAQRRSLVRNISLSVGLAGLVIGAAVGAFYGLLAGVVHELQRRHRLTHSRPEV